MMENASDNSTPNLKFLTVAQAAEYMGRSEDFVRLLCKEGQLPGAVQEYERGPWRIPIETVNTWLNSHVKTQTFLKKVASFPLWSKVLSTLTVLALISGFAADSLGFFTNVQDILAIATPTSTATQLPTHTLTVAPTVTPTRVDLSNTPTPNPMATQSMDQRIAIPSPEYLVGEWQMTWNSELVIFAISKTPQIGQLAGTVGYLFKDEKSQCGIDVWFGGLYGANYKFNAKPESGNFAMIAGKVLPACASVNIEPFTHYEISFNDQYAILKQFYHDEEMSSGVIRRLGIPVNPDKSFDATRILQPTTTRMPLPTINREN